MLSILIPTYNYDVYPLACQIESQAIKSGITFEIICFDDGSLSSINRENNKINTLKFSKFTALKNNIGLSNIRNTLAKASTYENLLFIDGDSILIDDLYLIKYLNAIKKKAEVIYGGRIHPRKVDSKRKLRWKYGKFREDLNALQRKKNIYKSILFNNTLIKKSVFNKIGFEKSITQYGHEDTVFAYNLSKIKASILHIDNPVLHDDVDLNKTYICKTKKGLENLNLIYKTRLIEPDFVYFIKVFNKIKKVKLNYPLAFTYKIFHKILLFNLTSKNPSLRIFNLFRLSYFCYINLNK